MSDDEIEEIKTLPLSDTKASLLRIASKVNEVVRGYNKKRVKKDSATSMDDKVNSQESDVIRWALNPAITVTRPSATYIALFTASPTEAGLATNEVATASGYARQQVVMDIPVNGYHASTTEILFPVATAEYTVTHAGICKSGVRGTADLMYYAPLAVPVTVNIGEAFRFPAGAITASEMGSLSGMSATLVGGSTFTANMILTPGVPGATVDLDVVFHRHRAGINNAIGTIVLREGQLTAAQLELISVRISGVEQRIYVEALEGTYSDNSLFAFYLEVLNPGPTIGTDVYGVVSLGVSRTTTDIAKTAITLPNNTATPQENGIPDVLVACTNPAHLCLTDFLPEALPRSLLPLSAKYQSYDSDFEALEPPHWNTYATYNPTQNPFNYVDLTLFAYYYDRALVYFQMYRRTGNITYLKRGRAMASNYMNYFAYPNSIPPQPGAQPYYVFPWGVAALYWLGGVDKARVTTKQVADALDIVFTATIGTGNEDPRNSGRIMLGFLVASMMNFGSSYRTKLMTMMNALLTAPYWGSGYYNVPEPPNCPNHAQTNFMHTILSHTLELYYDRIDPDVRIPPKVKSTCDFLWTQWRSSDTPVKSFNYLSAFCAGEGDIGPAPDLTGFFVTPFSWYYRQSGDVSYLTKADEIFNNYTNDAAYLEKQFNQLFLHPQTYFKYRLG